MRGQKKRQDDPSVPTVETPPPGARPVEPRRVHRRARLVPFLVTGVVIGVLVGAFLRWRADEATLYSASQEWLVLLGFGAVSGLFLGAVVYVVVDLIDARR